MAFRAALLGTAAALMLTGLGVLVLRGASQTLGRDPVTTHLPASTPTVAPLDLNTASAAALETLPGIGPARARRIVASRTADGPFRSPEDLVTRGLVPASVLERFSGRVTVTP